MLGLVEYYAVYVVVYACYY